MDDIHSRKYSQGDRLRHEGIHAENHGHARNHGGGSGKPHHGIEQRSGNEAKKNISLSHLCAAQEKCPLAQIIQKERGVHERKPSDANSLLAEVAQVRVQRLAARQHKEHRAHHRHRRFDPNDLEECDGVPGVKRREDNVRAPDDLRDPERRNGDKPAHHHRPVDIAHLMRAVTLEPKQTRHNEHGERNDPRLKRRCRHLEAFHRREHGNGRRDHAIAEEQARSRYQEQAHDRERLPRQRAVEKTEKRKHATLAFIVSPQHEDEVLAGEHEGEQPKNQAHRAIHMRRRCRNSRVTEKHLIHRVERRGADVAVHHPQCAEGKTEEGPSFRKHEKGLL